MKNDCLCYVLIVFSLVNTVLCITNSLINTCYMHAWPGLNPCLAHDLRLWRLETKGREMKPMSFQGQQVLPRADQLHRNQTC